MPTRSRLGMRLPVRLVVLAALGVAGLALAPAAAADDSTQPYPLVENCDHPTEQLCTPVASVEVMTDGVLVVDFRAAPTHCSQAIAHLIVDGSEKFVSPPLNPGEATGPQDFGPVEAGRHALGVQIEGAVGGCNVGGLAGWAGTLTVTVSTAAQATPTPPPPQATPTPPPGPAPTPTPGPGAAGGALATTDYTPILGFAALVLVIGGGLAAYSYLRR